MSKLYAVISFLAFLLFCPVVNGAKPSNIVIADKTETYRFVTASDGVTLKCIENTTELTFRAGRTADTALAMVYFNDDISIDKATGGKSHYGSFFPEDVFYSDSKACIVTVNLKKPGAEAKAYFKRTYNKPEFFCSVMLSDFYPVEKATVIFDMPESIESRFSMMKRNIANDKSSQSTERKNGRVKTIYTVSDIPTPQIYKEAPSINETAPTILVLGHFDGVGSLYRYLRSYLPDSDPGQAAIDEKARQLTSGLSTDKEKIDAVTDFVHNKIRYVAVEHGEYGHRPDLPSEVLRKTYGDCKGSAILIKSLLRSSGLDARLAWIGTDDIPHSWTEVPNISSGNHVIAAVMTGDSLLFLDGTARFTRAGSLPCPIQGRQAIVEDGPENFIVKTLPVYAPQTNSLKNTVRLSLSETGELKGDISAVMTGQRLSTIQYMIEEVTPGARNELYSAIMQNSIDGAKISNAVFDNHVDSVALRGQADLSGAVSKIGSEMFVDLNLGACLHARRFSHPDMTVEGDLKNLCHILSAVTVDIPENMEAADIPDTVKIDNPWFTASLSTSFISGKLHRQLEFTSKTRRVPSDKLKEYNTDLMSMIRACSSKIIIRK